jgi:hypothetical protein
LASGKSGAVQTARLQMSGINDERAIANFQFVASLLDRIEKAKIVSVFREYNVCAPYSSDS